MATTQPEALLSEEYVQNCFHSYLKSALTQAKAERLLDTEVLSSAEADLMITGPALCLYFAALRSTTNPPSVPLPRLSKSHDRPAELSLSNCPVSFRPFLNVWTSTVPSIQSLPPEHQHDLARIICNLSPVAHPRNVHLNGIAADLRAVAIEISMRRTFQERYAQDLQVAIDAGRTLAQGARVEASFVPPPVYDEAVSPPPPSPTLPPQSPSLRTSSPSTSRTPSPQPTIFGPAIEFIRETLYAALADELERVPLLRRLLKRDPARGYFAAVAFAILDVATSSVSTDGEEPLIWGVLDKSLSLSDCPVELQPFMRELCALGVDARTMEDEDSEASVRALQADPAEELPMPRMDRVRQVLRGGVGWVYDDANSDNEHENEDTGRGGVGRKPTTAAERGERRRTVSTQNRAVAYANRINALALGITKLGGFRERQEEVFQVLVGVGGRNRHTGTGTSRGASDAMVSGTAVNGEASAVVGGTNSSGVAQGQDGKSSEAGKPKRSRWRWGIKQDA